MLVLEAKLKGKEAQYDLIEEAIRTALFCRNKASRYWMDNENISGYDLNKQMAVLPKEFDFANKLGRQARQSSAERVWSSISKFYANCKKKVSGKKGFPKFKKRGNSVEYKKTGLNLSDDRKILTLTDGLKIGRLKLVSSRDLNFYQVEQIKRVRVVRRADGYYDQFCVDVDRREQLEPSLKTIGLDVGLNHFYTDSDGNGVENPRFLRKSERKLKKLQRKDFAVKASRCVVRSNNLIADEDLNVRNMVKNHSLAKSISDASWSMFRQWIECFGNVFGTVTIAVPSYYTSQNCSNCGILVKKTLSTRTHLCKCGCVLDRDHNAALNILASSLSRVGHTQTQYACGEINLCPVDERLVGKLAQ